MGARAVKIRESDERSQFKVYSPIEPGTCDKAVVGARRVLTWKTADGVETVKARLVAKGYVSPGLAGSGDARDVACDVGTREFAALPSSSHFP